MSSARKTTPRLPEPYESMFGAVNKDCSLEAIRALVHLGADLNYRHPETGQTALYCACMANHPGTVEALLKNGADPNLRITYRSPIDKRVEIDRLALHYAWSSGVAKALIEAGSDVNAADIDGTTPLMRAAFRGSPEVAKMLIAAGASPLARQKKRRGHQACTARELSESKIAFFKENISDYNREIGLRRLECHEQTRAILLEAEKQYEAG